MAGGEKLTAGEKVQNALVECLKEKMNIEDITVSYLSERACVGKSTFYRHYKDLYDVYEQLVDGFVSRCEKLIVKLFFEKNMTVREAAWIIIRNGTDKDNELFCARDAVLIHYSIEKCDARIFDILYAKMHALIVQIAKRVYDDDEAADFGATFILSGNLIPILSNLHMNGKLKLETVLLSFEIFEQEMEKWKQNQQLT